MLNRETQQGVAQDEHPPSCQTKVCDVAPSGVHISIDNRRSTRVCNFIGKLLDVDGHNPVFSPNLPFGFYDQQLVLGYTRTHDKGKS